MDVTSPGITELEAVARGRVRPDVLAAAFKAGLASGNPEIVVQSCEALWMAAAYHRRAGFERTQFAEVPAYQVAPHFALPLTCSGEDLTKYANTLEPWLVPGHAERGRAQRAMAAFDHAVLELGHAGQSLAGRVRSDPGPPHGRAWYPGARYVEAPMQADDVITFADEWALVQRLGHRIAATVARVATVTGCPRAHGNHAKATVLAASMEADPRARPEWQRLLGSTAMRGGLRLSNSSPDLRTVDHKGNLMGFRFSVMTDRSCAPFTTSNAAGGWFTLTANSAPGAHVRTPERHIAFTDSIGSPHASPVALLGSVFAGSRGIPHAVRDAARIVGEVAHAIPQGKAVSAHPRLDELVFHSRHAYRLGAQAVRYIVRVVEPRFPDPPRDWQMDPDYRHRALLGVVGATEIIATIGMQILPDFTGADADARALYHIEDMRADWAGIPDEPFALVRIPPQTTDMTPERERMVQWFAENPVDLVRAGGPLAPLGAAGRSRTVVYDAGMRARRASPALGVPPRLVEILGAGGPR